MVIHIAEAGCQGLKLKEPACNLCLRVCRQRALTFDKELKVNESLCTECGLCHGICPTGNFILTGPNQMAVEKVEQLVAEGNQEIVLACEKSRGSFQCLGAIDQETLLCWIGLGVKKLYINSNSCNACKLRGLELFLLRVERVKEIVDSWQLEFEIDLNMSEKCIEPELKYDRRRFFDYLGKSAVGVLGNAVEINTNNLVKRKTIKEQRKRLIDRVDKAVSNKRNLGIAVSTKKGCRVCNICSAFCPSNALFIEEKEGHKALMFKPSLCTGCGFCLKACPSKMLVPVNRGFDVGEIVLKKKEQQVNTIGYWG